MQRAMEEMQHRLALLTASDARHGLRSPGAASSGSPPPPGGAPSERAARRTTSQPKKLTYANASVPRALEDWLYEVELYCEQLELPKGAPWIGEARFVMDRDLWDWWTEYKGQAQQKGGAPIDKWPEFAAALRAQFVATSERRAAIDELCEVRQKAGEGMAEYFLRATQLHSRVRKEMQDATVMRLVLARVRREEWPFTYGKAINSVEGGSITSLAELRAFMQQEALAEPGKTGARQVHAGAPATPHGAPSSNSGGRHQGRRRVAAAERKEDPDDDSDQQEEGAPATVTHVNAATSGGSTGGERRRCFRCNETGHLAPQCTKPDKRECFVCGRVGTGHMAASCPERRHASSDGAHGPAVATAKKNPSSKNG